MKIPIELHYSKSPGLFYLDLGNGKRSAYFSRDQADRILTTLKAETKDGDAFQEALDGLMYGEREFDTVYIEDTDRGLAMSLMTGTVIKANPKNGSAGELEDVVREAYDEEDEDGELHMVWIGDEEVGYYVGPVTFNHTPEGPVLVSGELDDDAKQRAENALIGDPDSGEEELAGYIDGNQELHFASTRDEEVRVVVGADDGEEEEEMQSLEMEKFESLIHEAEGMDPRREVVVGKLIDQFKSIGVSFPPDQSTQYQSMFSQLTKVLSLLNSTQASAIHRGALAPLLLELVKFEYFPIDPKELATRMQGSAAFDKLKAMKGFPYSLINYYVGSQILAREEKRADSRLIPGSVNMRDLIDYLRFIRMNSMKVTIPG